MSAVFSATSSTSRALSAGNGRASGPVLTTTTSPTRTSKTPLRGFSALTLISAPSSATSSRAATLAARVLNAFQDLQASTAMGGKLGVVAPPLNGIAVNGIVFCAFVGGGG